MKLSSNLVLSAEILAAHKLRTLLSVLGIVVGVGAVVLMVSLGRGAEEQILASIRSMGTNLVVVNAGQTRVVAGRQRQLATVTTLVPEDAEAIAAECPAVLRAAPAVERRMAARWEANSSNTAVVGMPEEGFLVRDVTAATGRLFDAYEDRGRRRVAVLGPTAAVNLFDDTDPIGLVFRIGRVPFTVIGVTAPKGVDVNGNDQDDVIFVPLQTAMRRLMNVTHLQAVYAEARGSDHLDAAEEEIRAVLRERHRLGDRPDDFTIQNQATLLAAERETAQAMTLLVGSVAGISPLVGGVGILAVMLISVRERTAEIGLRRAVGATRGDIRNQFLLESAMLAAAGGLIGVLGGMGGATAADALDLAQSAPAWSAAAVSLAFSVTVGVVFGLYPAIRAAALEPIEALRAD